MQKVAGVVILKRFFGFRPGHESLKDFNDELKALSPADKLWLVQAAAKELGCDIADPIITASQAAA